MKILVWKNKYDDRYYDASTPEALERAARKIVAQLVADGWIISPGKLENYWSYTRLDHEMLSVSDEELAGLPKKFQDQVQTARKAQKEVVAQFREEEGLYLAAKRLANGEIWTQVWRKRKPTQTDADWDELSTAILKRFPDATLENDQIFRPVTAWRLLEARNGYEYENYDVHEVQTDD